MGRSLIETLRARRWDRDARSRRGSSVPAAPPGPPGVLDAEARPPRAAAPCPRCRHVVVPPGGGWRCPECGLVLPDEAVLLRLEPATQAPWFPRRSLAVVLGVIVGLFVLSAAFAAGLLQSGAGTRWPVAFALMLLLGVAAAGVLPILPLILMRRVIKPTGVVIDPAGSVELWARGRPRRRWERGRVEAWTARGEVGDAVILELRGRWTPGLGPERCSLDGRPIEEVRAALVRATGVADTAD